MKRLLGKLICTFSGHKRGKVIDGPRPGIIEGVMYTIKVCQCPRCGRIKHYKAKQ